MRITMSKINEFLLDKEQKGKSAIIPPPVGFNDAHNEDCASVWDFVIKYYPNYYHCPIITRSDELQRLLDKEYNTDKDDEAYKLLVTQYRGNSNNSKIREDSNAILIIIYEETITEFLKQRIL